MRGPLRICSVATIAITAIVLKHRMTLMMIVVIVMFVILIIIYVYIYIYIYMYISLSLYIYIYIYHLQEAAYASRSAASLASL